MLPRSTAIVLAVAVVLLVLGSAAGKQQSKHSKQSKQSGVPIVPPRTDGVVTNVHVVCHTHDDVGWLKTVDQYYMGSNNSIQFAGVQYVLDSVMLALEANPKRKFIYVEVAFFIRWWREQTPGMQQRVKQLVANGQLEFINGGWCMNDEAATHYYDIVDQMTRGHEFLLAEFGVKPTIGWHIDPFGHSAAQAELFALMKFDAFFFGRIDYQDKQNRLSTQTMEVMWRPSSSLGTSAQIFAGVTFNGYGPPDSFNWDVYSQDQPIQDDPRLEDVNIYERAEAFAQWVRWAASYYATPNVMLTMGSDFEYNNANTWFKNLDKLLTYMQQNTSRYGDLNLFYSTPSQYLKSVNAANPNLQVKSDDFFPYSDWEHAMWTGYFTSRVALKGYVRAQSSYLQSCKQMETIIAPATTPSHKTAQRLIDAMSVAQHHDAVSGTSKQHVAYDYAKRISIGQADCATLIGESITKLSVGSAAPSPFSVCPLLNVSICATTNNLASNSLAVVFYNNLGRARDEYVRLPVNSNSLSVSDANNMGVASVTMANNDKGAAYWLVFQVAVPAFGFSTYFVNTGNAEAGVADSDEPISVGKPTEVVEPANHLESAEPAGGESFIENSVLRLIFSDSGLSSVTNKVSGVTVNVNHSIMWYKPSLGDAEDSQASGAYIFRPDGDAATPNSLGTPTLSITTSSLVQEATLQWGSWATAIIRLYGDDPYAEIEYTIGPIDISDKIGKEVITRWQTDWSCDKTFYTDSNGREMQERVINYRPTWPLQVFEPVAGNYYPVNSAAGLRDSAQTKSLMFLTDRSQGGGGVDDGELEIMIHRRLLADDSRGVGEPLNETYNGEGLIVRTRHYMLLDSLEQIGASHRLLAEQLANPLSPLFAPTQSGPVWMSSHVGNWSAFARAASPSFQTGLPPQIHLQTVQTLADGSVLLRLEHLFEANESNAYSIPTTIDFTQSFFPILGKSQAREYSLSANQPIVAGNKPTYQWTTQGNVNNFSPPVPPAGAVTSVTLYPMQIRTFILT